MRNILRGASVAVAMLGATTFALAQSSVPPKDTGYASGSSNSGASGMASSRGVPTSPTAGQAGTVDNGHPDVSKTTGAAKSPNATH